MPLKGKSLTLEGMLRKIQEKKGVFHSFLHMSTKCFEAAVKIRNYFYDSGIKKGKKAPLPIISIGNIAVGGTGKTPFTIFLAKALQEHYRIAILSRGYRSLAEKRSRPLVVSEGEGHLPLLPPDIVGDEAYLMALNLPYAIVISGKNRFLGALEAKKRGADLVLLDDGMQHRKLLRDLEIVLINGEENRDCFLPFGRLRDDPRRLVHADFIVSRDKTFSEAITISDRIVGIVGKDGKIRESLIGLPVFVFCGIANPSSFIKTVEECGAHVVDFVSFADHEKISEEGLKSLVARAEEKGACLLLTTEKDFVKYEKISLALPLFWVKREIYISGNSHKWDVLIHRIRGLVI